VRADLGYPPLVTPSSQMVGAQATLNVLLGKRYAVIPNEVKAYVKGLYGKPPAPIAPEVIEMVAGDGAAIDCRPADLLPPELEKRAAELDGLVRSPEDLVTYSLFPQIGREFLQQRGRSLSSEKVAALAVAMARPSRPPVPIAEKASPERPAGGRSAWKMASRQAMLGDGWGRPW
jgi:pyruvate/oxaloacetate carboxyltransferase